MTAVVSTYLLIAPEGFSLSPAVSYYSGVFVALLILTIFLAYLKKIRS